MFTVEIRHDTRITLSIDLADLHVVHDALVDAKNLDSVALLTSYRHRVSELIDCIEEALLQARTDDVTIKSI